jgi:hypothetical protein
MFHPEPYTFYNFFDKNQNEHLKIDIKTLKVSDLEGYSGEWHKNQASTVVSVVLASSASPFLVLESAEVPIVFDTAIK